MLADLESLERRIVPLEKKAKSGEKDAKADEKNGDDEKKADEKQDKEEKPAEKKKRPEDDVLQFD